MKKRTNKRILKQIELFNETTMKELSKKYYNKFIIYETLKGKVNILTNHANYESKS